MLVVTSGILLHTTKYADTSVIAKIFTREVGLHSYMVKGVRGGKSHVKQNLLQPMSYLDLVVYNNPNKQINHIKEIHSHPVEIHRDNTGICEDRHNYDPTLRNAIIFFINEVAYKVLKDEEVNIPYFDYITSVLEQLRREEEEKKPLNPHLPILFLLETSLHLGLYPQDNYSCREPFFDKQEGRFVGCTSETTLDAAESMHLHQYLTHTPHPSVTLSDRTRIINSLLDYFQIHLDSFRNFKSHEILHDLLNSHNVK